MDQRKADWLARKKASGAQPPKFSEEFLASVAKYRAWKAANPSPQRQLDGEIPKLKPEK